MIELGSQNQKCLDGMRAWCKHVEIVRESEGLYAQMSGLPIATHSISCPNAHGKFSSMNLLWVFSDFLRDHCNGCTYHSPSASAAWGNSILQAQREDQATSEQKQAEETARITALRADLANRSRKIGESAPPETREIIRFLELLFSEDESLREAMSKRLVESANLAPELFPKESISLLIALAASTEHAKMVLPICIALARCSQNFRLEFLSLATQNIENEIQLELSSELLDALGEIVKYPLSEAHLIKLIHSQRHDKNVIFWHQSPQNYEWHLTALRKSYDADPILVRKLFQSGLLERSDHIRIRYCGVLRQIQKTHPTIVLELLDTILSSLEFYETNDGGSSTPSGQIVRILKQAFRYSPKVVDQRLGNSFDYARPAVKEDLIRVYADQFDRNDILGDGDPAALSQMTLSELIAFERLFLWTKQESIELDLRGDAAEALENASSQMPKALNSRFDVIFGYLALIVVAKEPPEPPPKIVIPGETADPRLAGLQENSRRQDWFMLKDRLTRCLQNLVKEHSDIHFATVSGCLENTTANVGEELKKICMTLLGTMGKNYQMRPKVISLLMKGLMDYESVWVRSTAIDAICKMFRFGKSPPPSNIVDIIIVHLRDTFTMVHKAAVQAISRCPRWFEEEQAFEAMISLEVHLKVYKNDLHQLDNICDAILGLANRHRRVLAMGVKLVSSALPTGERYSDQKIIANLVRVCPEESPFALTVAVQVGRFLSRERSDRINGYEHDRKEMFEWLFQLPSQTYEKVANRILEFALRMAKHDPWEACHFASLFAQHRDFAKERLVVMQIIESLPDEPRHKEFRDELTQLETVAFGNALLLEGKTDAAASAFSGDAGEVS
jgi:hypothetical protein